MESLFSLSYLNCSYLHLRQCHQRWHLLGLQWNDRRQNPSFGQQRGWTIKKHSSRTGGYSSWWICLSWFANLLSWYFTSQCHYICAAPQNRQSDLEVKNLHLHQAKLYHTCILPYTLKWHVQISALTADAKVCRIFVTNEPCEAVTTKQCTTFIFHWVPWASP